jgi:DNA polymerase I-like protein with 3'-5' exonuclease and polymerase domains
MKRIVLDIETDLSHQKIHLVITKDLDTEEVKTWKEAKPFQDYIKDATLIVAHNGIGFDFPVLNRQWNTKIGLKRVFDTLIVSRLLDPSREQGHSLEAWGNTLKFQKINYKATWQWLQGRREEYDGECFDKPIDSLMEHYCSRDVEVCAKLYLKLCNDLNEKQFSQDSVELEHKVAAIIAEQERNGFKLDTVWATCLLTDIKGKMAGIYEQMQHRWPPYEVPRVSEKTGKQLKPLCVTFNPGSRKQIGEKLIELGWKPKKFTETGQAMVDEGTLSEIKNIPEAAMIAEYLMLQKRVAQIESWLEAVKDDGRVHGKVITNGAVTGRATHSSPNMGQVPNTSSIYGAECRECWTVEEGNVQVGVDLSGIELRCLSHYMQDAEWQHELLEGDVHWKNTQAFGLVPMGTVKEDIKEHKDARNLSKTLTYSVLYGAGPAKVGSTVGGSAKEGGKLIDNFMKNTPSLRKLKDKVDKFSAKGWVPGLDGRKIWVRSEHAALNSLLQSAGAIIAKKWIVCFTEELKAKKIPYKLLAWVHDEVQIETKPEYGDMVGKIVVESARRAGELLKFRCPVDAEYRIGKNWHDCH